MSGTDELRSVRDRCRSLVQLGYYARQEAQRRSSTSFRDFAQNVLGIDINYEQEKAAKKSVLRAVGKLCKQIEENCFLEVVCTLERILIREMGRNDRSLIRKLRDDSNDDEFAGFCAPFLDGRSSVQNLSDVARLLAGVPQTTMSPSLREVVRYRDYLAHGKRFAKPFAPPGFEEACGTIFNILQEIGVQ